LGDDYQEELFFALDFDGAQQRAGYARLFGMLLCLMLLRCCLLLFLRRGLALLLRLRLALLLLSRLPLLLRNGLPLRLRLPLRLSWLPLLLWRGLALLLGSSLLPLRLSLLALLLRLNLVLLLWCNLALRLGLLTLLRLSWLPLLRCGLLLRLSLALVLLLSWLPLLLSLALLVLLLLGVLLKGCSRAALLGRNLVVHLRRSLNAAIGGQRPTHDRIGWPSVVYIGKLRAVEAGDMFMLNLRPHGRRVLFTKRHHFRGSGVYLQAALAPVEAHSIAAPVFIDDPVVVYVVHFPGIDVVDRAVVVEVTAAPIAAVIAKADVAKAIVHAAIVAHVRTPVAAEKSVAVVPVAPVSRGPKRAFIGSLHPRARNPIIAA